MGSTVFPAPASGPTLAEITTAIQNNSLSSNKWTLISSQNFATSNATGITFSGLSGYKRYRLIARGITSSTSGQDTFLRFNGISSTIYSQTQMGSSNGSTTSLYTDNNQSGFYVGSITNQQFGLNIVADIEGADVNGIKTVNGLYTFFNAGNYPRELKNSMVVCDAITSISLTTNPSSTYTGGTIALYGAN